MEFCSGRPWSAKKRVKELMELKIITTPKTLKTLKLNLTMEV